MILYVLEVILQKKADKRLPVLKAMGIRMLRWVGEIYLYELRMNNDIRRFMKMTCITKRAREARLRWYGHVIRRETSNFPKTVWHTSGEERRRRGGVRLLDLRI